MRGVSGSLWLLVSSLAFAKLPALSPLPLPANTVEVGQAVKKGWVVYEVKPGDTLAGIAARYGVDPRHIMWSSNLQGDRLQVGQRLLIPLVAVEDRSPRVPRGWRCTACARGIPCREWRAVMG